MAGLSSRQIQIAALCLASLLVLVTSLAYLTVEREFRVAGQRLTHHMAHLEEDIETVEAALGRLAFVSRLGFFPTVQRGLLVEPEATAGDRRSYAVRDPAFDLKLQLDMLASGDPGQERTVFGMFGVIAALQFYSGLAQTSSISPPLMLMSQDAEVRISTACLAKSDTLHSIHVNACRNREAIWDAIASRAGTTTDAVQLASITMQDGSVALLAYRRLDLSESGMPLALANRGWIAVAPFDIDSSLLTQSADSGLIGAGPGNASRLELYDRRGSGLSEGKTLVVDVAPGWTMRPEGMVYRADGASGLSVRYVIPYRYYVEELGPRLAAVLFLILISNIATLFLAKWYLQRYYEPARRQQKRIEEGETFGRQVIDAAQLAVIVCAWPAGEVLRANDVAVEWFGGEAALRAAAANCAASHDEGYLLSHEGLSLKLAERHILATYQKTRYEGRDALLCTFRDVSGDVQAREALIRAKQAADEANAAKSTFLATMSHEIRTPLYGALGMLELLAATPLSEVQRGFVRTIQSSSDQLLTVIGDVLDMSKIEAGGLALHVERFSPLDLTECVVQMYGGKASEKGLFLHCVVDGDVPDFVDGDGGRLRQILTNLVSNAIKFTEAGRIVVALTVESQDQNVAQLLWRISDTGVGMSEGELAQVFEPFYQARTSRLAGSGTGLGLAICHTLAQLMGGGIDALSQRNVGSTFLVRIPLAVEPPAGRVQPAPALDGVRVYVRAPTQELREHYRDWLEKWGAQCITIGPERPQMEGRAVLLQVMPEQMSPFPVHPRQVFCTQAGPLRPDPVLQGWQVNCHAIRSIALAVGLAAGRQSAMPALDVQPAPDPARQGLGRLALRVLVVDDSQLNRDVLGRQLQSLGCDVTLCGDPERALDLWSDEVFDLLLTDMNMPGMNGRELVAKLRERGMKRPAVCVTADAVSEAPSVRDSESSISAWLVKPVTANALRICLLKACSEVHPEDEAASAAGAAPGGDVPDFVREAFVSAMSADALLLRQAITQQDAQAARDILHRVRGGLVMANSAGMAQACVRMEADLAVTGFSPELENDMDHFIGILQSRIEEVKAAMARPGMPGT